LPIGCTSLTGSGKPETRSEKLQNLFKNTSVIACERFSDNAVTEPGVEL
jgi:hypothetical protein